MSLFQSEQLPIYVHHHRDDAIKLGMAIIAGRAFQVDAAPISMLSGGRWLNTTGLVGEPLRRMRIKPDSLFAAFQDWNDADPKTRIAPNIHDLFRERDPVYGFWREQDIPSSSTHWDFVREMAEEAISSMRGSKGTPFKNLGAYWKRYPWLLLVPSVLVQALDSEIMGDSDFIDTAWMLSRLHHSKYLTHVVPKGAPFRDPDPINVIELLRFLAEYTASPEKTSEVDADLENIIEFIADLEWRREHHTRPGEAQLLRFKRTLKKRMKMRIAREKANPVFGFIIPDFSRVLSASDMLKNTENAPPVFDEPLVAVSRWLRQDRALRMMEVVTHGDRARWSFSNLGRAKSFEDFSILRHQPFRRVRATVSIRGPGGSAAHPFAEDAYYDDLREFGRYNRLTGTTLDREEVGVYRHVRYQRQGFSETWEALEATIPGYPDISVTRESRTY